MRLAQGHNTVWPEWGSNPRPLDPESEALTTRPPRSPNGKGFERIVTTPADTNKDQYKSKDCVERVELSFGISLPHLKMLVALHRNTGSKYTLRNILMHTVLLEHLLENWIFVLKYTY